MFDMLLKNTFCGLGLIAFTALQAQTPAHLSAARTGARTGLAPFYHGVASGDPLSDRVIIWTRLTTDSATANVKWRIATDTNMVNVLDSGIVATNSSKDFTVKVDVGGLQPNSTYFYEFEAYQKYSLRGRTKTLPVGDVDSVRLAVVSCSNYAAGFFNGYKSLKDRNDVDIVLHLGDYIYEYGDGQFGSERNLQPSTEILSLSDYRTRHSYYKLDEDLIRLHQQYPFISVWDDHETANDSWYGGAANHTTATEGDWFDRKSAGTRAYHEWQPIRRPDAVDTQRIYRRFRIGDLIDLHMMDTRLQAREEQNGIDNSPTRTLIGNNQFNWLVNGMDTSTARWQILGQQVMMAPVKLPTTTFPFTPATFLEDQWDGYPAERQRLYDSIFAKNIQNMVVLTGDIHTSWANDLPVAGYNSTSGAGSAGVEFVVSSLTSQNFPFPVPLSIIQNFNGHVKYGDLTAHGFMILDVNKTRSQMDWYNLSTITSQNFTTSRAASWYVQNGERFLRNANAGAVVNPNRYTYFAPLDPRGILTSVSEPTEFALESVLLGVYPNPFQDQLTYHYTVENPSKVRMQITSLSGQVVQTQTVQQEIGVHRQTVHLDQQLSAGAYIFSLEIGGKMHQRVIVKQ